MKKANKYLQPVGGDNSAFGPSSAATDTQLTQPMTSFAPTNHDDDEEEEEDDETDDSQDSSNTSSKSSSSSAQPHKSAQTNKTKLPTDIPSYKLVGKMNPFVCKRCEQKFTLKSNLKRHIANVHGGAIRLDKTNYSFYCKWHKCSFKSDVQAQISRHVTVAHMGSDATKNTSYYIGRNKIDHLSKGKDPNAWRKNGPSKPPPDCAQCGRHFVRAEMYKRHVRSHEKAGVRCMWPKCGFFFTLRQIAQKHVSVDHLKDVQEYSNKQKVNRYLVNVKKRSKKKKPETKEKVLNNQSVDDQRPPSHQEPQPDDDHGPSSDPDESFQPDDDKGPPSHNDRSSQSGNDQTLSSANDLMQPTLTSESTRSINETDNSVISIDAEADMQLDQDRHYAEDHSIDPHYDFSNPSSSKSLADEMNRVDENVGQSTENVPQDEPIISLPAESLIQNDESTREHVASDHDNHSRSSTPDYLPRFFDDESESGDSSSDDELLKASKAEFTNRKIVYQHLNRVDPDTNEETPVVLKEMKIRPPPPPPPPNTVKCPTCEAGFSSFQKSLQHYREQHLGWKPYYCTGCDFVAAKYASVVEHANKQHFNSKDRQSARGFVAKRQNGQAPNDAILESLLKSCLKKSKQTRGQRKNLTSEACTECGRMFAANYMKAHLRKHQRPGYWCTWSRCGFFFSSHEWAQRHICTDHMQCTLETVTNLEEIDQYLVND